MEKNTVEKLSKKLKLYRILCFLLVVLIPLVGWFSYKENKSYSPLGNFPLLDPAREYTPQNNYITNIQGLRDYLSGLGKQYPDSISIYYEQINSGSNISVNKDLQMYPASLVKPVQAILITKKIEDGVMTWDQELKAEPADLSSDAGTLYKTIGDSSMTVEDLMRAMISDSDATAQNIFRHYLEVSDYLKFQEETGLDNLYNDKGLISAKEYTRVLRVLYTSSFLHSRNSEKILQFMVDATFRDYLSEGIPDGIKFAHKYGENVSQNVFLDSGIVYVPGKPYMLTVIIQGKDSSDATQTWAKGLMKEISQHAYASSI